MFGDPVRNFEDVEGMPSRIEVGDDRLDCPVAIAIDDIAGVTLGEELGVERVRVELSGQGQRVAFGVHGVQRRLTACWWSST
jgi:hypothetical protein